MRLPRLCLAIILLSCLVSSCGEGLVISMDEKLPPTFRYKGNRFAECCKSLNFFVVSEVPLGNPDAENKYIWWIWPQDGAHNEYYNLPTFTYGKVPDGWRQTIPENGEPPPPLVEGRTYEAGGNFHSGQDAHLRFTIRNGKAVSLQ